MNGEMSAPRNLDKAFDDVEGYGGQPADDAGQAACCETSKHSSTVSELPLSSVYTHDTISLHAAL